MTGHPEDTTSEQDGSYNDEVGDEEEVEEVMEMSEEELLKMLDSQEPPLQVCSRLFKDVQPKQAALKHLMLDQIAQLQAEGYLIVDGYLSSEVSKRLHSEALLLHDAGSLEQAAKVGLLPDMALDKFTDVHARGDRIMWLHGSISLAGPTSASVHAMTKLEELQQDLHLVMNLEQQRAEYQLAVYAENGSQYVKHRDALPDDGGDPNQRRVTAILYANTNWQREHGGQLRIWLPSSKTKQVKFPQEKLQSIAEHNQATPEAENRQPSQPRPEQLGCSQEQNSHAVTPQASDNIKHSGQHHHPDDAQHVQLQLADVSLEPRELKTAAFQNANRSSCAEDCTDSNSQRAVDPQAFTQLRRDCRPSCIQESQDPPSDRSSNGAETSDADEEGEAQGQSRDTRGQHIEGVHFTYALQERVVDIDPLPGRLVVFMSGAIDHAVLPSYEPRVALTAWCR